MNVEEFFPATYEQSRERFVAQLANIQKRWPATRLQAHKLKQFPDLSIDWMWAEPPRRDKVLVLTTGEHGIEGFAGAAVMKLFIDEFAPRLRAEDTGLLLVHAMNPWGMKHLRKVTSNNVDLNRNFVIDGSFDEDLNPDYRRLQDLLTPQRPLTSFVGETIRFLAATIRALGAYGFGRVSTAALLGQHHTPQGFFFGGTAYEENTEIVMSLYRRALEEYESVLHLDIHTGYGPSRQMSIIISPADSLASAEASRKFAYPLVQKINAGEFYEIHGDMQEYYYRLQQAEFPGKSLFACGFEFGTFGNSLPALLRSLRSIVLENQLYWHGARSQAAARAVQREYREHYIPTSRGWRLKALEDARQALEGIFRAQGFFKKEPEQRALLRL